MSKKKINYTGFKKQTDDYCRVKSIKCKKESRVLKIIFLKQYDHIIVEFSIMPVDV